MKTVLFVVFTVFCVNSIYCLWEEFAGDYYVKINAFTKCRDVGKESYVIPARLSRINRTHKMYSHNVSLPYDITNAYYLNVAISSRGTNGHSWNALMNITEPICTFFTKYVQELMNEIFASTGKTFVCPIKKGIYLLNYAVPDIYCNMIPLVPVFPYGDYRMELAVFSKNESNFEREHCLAVFFEGRPLYEIRGGCPNRRKSN